MGHRNRTQIWIIGALALLTIAAMTLLIWNSGGDQRPPPSTKSHNVAQASSAVQRRWNGSWYGYFRIMEAWGEWAQYEEDIYDAFMLVEVNHDGDGAMVILIGDKERQMIEANITADIHHFETVSGHLLDMPLAPSQWWLGISPVDPGNLVVISDTYLAPENENEEGFLFQSEFRPLGELWPEPKRIGDKLPPGYDHYLKTLEEKDTPGENKGYDNDDS